MFKKKKKWVRNIFSWIKLFEWFTSSCMSCNYCMLSNMNTKILLKLHTLEVVISHLPVDVHILCMCGQGYDNQEHQVLKCVHDQD